MERVLGYRFRNRTLRSALLPPSPSRPDPTAFQRLEFLGDRVLGLLLTERLFAEYPDAPEGALSIRLSHLASGEVLALVARESGLADAVAQDMEPEPFPAHRRALGDCVEASLGALWSDGGTEVARRFVRRHLAARIAALTEPPQDAKTALQEWTQARGLEFPRYTACCAGSGKTTGRSSRSRLGSSPDPVRAWLRRRAGETKRAAEKGRCGAGSWSGSRSADDAAAVRDHRPAWGAECRQVHAG